MLEEVMDYHLQQKQACVQHMVSELLNDLPSSDTESNINASESSSPSISSPSSASIDSGSESAPSVTHSGYGSGDSKSLDPDDLEDKLFEWGNARICELIIRILTA